MTAKQDWLLVAVAACVVSLGPMPLQVYGCRSEVCRRRRFVTQSETTLQLTGCSGQTKPWLRQLAFCLNKGTAEIAISMKIWYQTTYQQCLESCSSVKGGTRDLGQIEECVLCFTTGLPQSGLLQSNNVSRNVLDSCIRQYVYSSLSNELPKFEAVTQSRGRITLPERRPANDWWSLTVKLPCKPPLFQFWNAYCINSFSEDSKARDYVLAQNKLIFNNEIMFLARFSDACRFNIKDIQIIWSESVPAFALPQLSSFGNSFPPRGDQKGHIFFETKALAKLQMADGGSIPAEIRSEGTGPRRKRELSEATVNEVAASFSRLGLIMPCSLASFKMTDTLGLPVNVISNKKRHLVDTRNFWRMEDNKLELVRDISLLNFTLNFGLNGCFFGPSEVEVVVDPPDGWLDADLSVTCHSCNNVESEEDCLEEVTCHQGEICQSETRQITQDKGVLTTELSDSIKSKLSKLERHFKVSIKKSCKQATACENNYLNNMKQCKPGRLSSVCRCCCSSYLCNKESLHCI